MDKKKNEDSIKPVTEKRKPLEEALKKDNSSEALAKAIRTLLNKDGMN